jgi:hypothetical protein
LIEKNLRIPGLKETLQDHFTDALRRAKLAYESDPDSWFAPDYLRRVQEYSAGMDLLNDLVAYDRFTSLTSLKQCRHAMQHYVYILENDSSPLVARKVRKFIEEIDELWQAALE